MDRNKWPITASVASGQTEEFDTYGLLYREGRNGTPYSIAMFTGTNSKKLPEKRQSCNLTMIRVAKLGLTGQNIPYIKIWKAALEQGLRLLPEDIPMQFCLTAATLPQAAKVFFAVDTVAEEPEFWYWALTPHPATEGRTWTLQTFRRSNFHKEFDEDSLFFFWVPDEEKE